MPIEILIATAIICFAFALIGALDVIAGDRIVRLYHRALVRFGPRTWNVVRTLANAMYHHPDLRLTPRGMRVVNALDTTARVLSRRVLAAMEALTDAEAVRRG